MVQTQKGKECVAYEFVNAHLMFIAGESVSGKESHIKEVGKRQLLQNQCLNSTTTITSLRCTFTGWVKVNRNKKSNI